MAPWICYAATIIIAGVAAYVDTPFIAEHIDSLMQLCLCSVICGWLMEIWSDRKRIKRKLALLIMLGYAVWVMIADLTYELSGLYTRREFAVFAVMLAALLIGGGRHGARKR